MKRHRPAFTVIEVVIVIGLIILIIALLLPGTSRAHSAAAQAQARNNLLQLAIGTHSFHDVQKRLPSNGFAEKWGSHMERNAGSWLYQIAPFVEQEALYKNPMAYKNRPIPLFLCPGRERNGVTTEGKYTGPVTDYAWNGFLNDRSGDHVFKGMTFRIQAMPDGSSNTFLIGQLALRPEHYNAVDAARGRETFLVGGTTGTCRSAFVLLEDEKAGAIDREFGSPFRGGSYFCMGDASVRKVGYEHNLQGGLKPDDMANAPEDINLGAPGRRW